MTTKKQTSILDVTGTLRSYAEVKETGRKSTSVFLTYTRLLDADTLANDLWIQEHLGEQYRTGMSGLERACVSLLNAITEQRRIHFVMTRDSTAALLRGDKNWKAILGRNARWSNKTYQPMIDFLANGLKWVKFTVPADKRLPMVCEVVHPLLLERLVIDGAAQKREVEAFVEEKRLSLQIKDAAGSPEIKPPLLPLQAQPKAVEAPAPQPAENPMEMIKRQYLLAIMSDYKKHGKTPDTVAKEAPVDALDAALRLTQCGKTDAGLISFFDGLREVARKNFSGALAHLADVYVSGIDKAQADTLAAVRKIERAQKMIAVGDSISGADVNDLIQGLNGMDYKYAYLKRCNIYWLCENDGGWKVLMQVGEKTPAPLDEGWMWREVRRLKGTETAEDLAGVKKTLANTKAWYEELGLNLSPDETIT